MSNKYPSSVLNQPKPTRNNILKNVENKATQNLVSNLENSEVSNSRVSDMESSSKKDSYWGILSGTAENKEIYLENRVQGLRTRAENAEGNLDRLLRLWDSDKRNCLLKCLIWKRNWL